MAIEKQTRKRVDVVEKEETVTRSEVVEKEEEIEVPVCDFCQQKYPEEDKSFLTEVKLNPRVETRNHGESIEIPSHKGRNHLAKELRHALNEADLIGYRRMPVKEVQMEHSYSATRDSLPAVVETSTLDDVISYQFVADIPPPEMTNDGEMEICEFCTEMFNDE